VKAQNGEDRGGRPRGGGDRTTGGRGKWNKRGEWDKGADRTGEGADQERGGMGGADKKRGHGGRLAQEVRQSRWDGKVSLG
jgi:hypothetical protein